MAACRVKVCRICFSMDCQLHHLHEDMKLYKAYEAITELVLADEKDLPPYLCTDCADQLMNCAHFRHRSLQARLKFLDIIKKHGHISVKSIQDVIKTNDSDSDNKHTEEERIICNIEIEIKQEAIPEDPIATKLGDEIKTEYVGVGADDVLVGSEAIANPYVVEVNDIVKEEVIDDTPVKDNDDSKQLTKVFEIHSKNAVKCKNDPNKKKYDSLNIKTPPKTGAERARMCRLRKKLLAQESQLSSNEVLCTPSTSNLIMSFEPSPQPITGEDGFVNGLEGLSSAQKHKLNVVEAREGMEVTKDLNKMDVIQQECKEVNIKPLENIKTSSNFCGYENDSEKQFLNSSETHAKLHYCYLCDFKTESKENILAHMTLHSGNKSHSSNGNERSYSTAESNLVASPKFHRMSSQINNLSTDFSCQIDRKYSSEDGIERMLKHTDGKQYTCEKCDKSFGQKVNFQIHILKHLNVKRFTCDMCDKSFKQNSSLQYHMLVHSAVKPFSCEICKKPFRGKGNLRRHMLIHSDNDNKLYSCDVCDKSYTKKGSFQYHVLTHAGDKPFSCNICNNSFITKSSLNTHKLIHSDMKLHICELCKKTFRHKNNLTLHLRDHLGLKPFTCEICKKSFSRKFNLQNHMLTHTGEKQHVCNMCGRSFHQKFYLQRHLQGHLDEKPFKCHLCDKSFTIKYTLKMHVLTHSDVRPYTCDVCQTSYHTKNSLQSHILTHSDSKPYSCSICEKSFRKRHRLTHHMLVHSAVKQFSCDICKRSFREKGNLQRHMLIHIGIKPHKCEKCGASFRQKTSLQKHLLKH